MLCTSSTFTAVRSSLRRVCQPSGLKGRLGMSCKSSLATPGTVWDPEAVAYEPAQPQVSTSPDVAPLAWEGDLLAIGVYEEQLSDLSTTDDNPLKELNQELGGVLEEMLDTKPGTCSVLRVGKAARLVGLVSLGPEDKAGPVAEWGASGWQRAGAAVADAAKAAKVGTVGVFCPALSGAKATEGLVKGLLLGGYEGTRFKSDQEAPLLKDIQLLGAADSEGVTTGQAMAAGAALTRWLVEAPPNVCTPTYLAQGAAHIVSTAPEVMSLKVLDRDECEARNMGCYLAVAQGSAEPPKFIHLTYTPPGEVTKTVAIVGKGVTFDAGGYNIKTGPGCMIDLMKFDMGGSGATLGAARSIAALQPPGVCVHFIIAACENMIAGDAYRPGDVLKASNGTTVEVGNTDAEGRLTLADAIVYAQQECGATAVVDIATLTGACIVALGDGMGGMYANTDDMAADISAASRAAGEKLWRMPCEESYGADIKSKIADIKNVGGKGGGSITAALFLREFVEEDVAWSHLDIAGPVWNEKVGGATGFGAATLAEWVVAQGSD